MAKQERKRATPEEAGRFVVRILREAGHVALFAGGCVRDRLLGRPPKDVDVATSALPDQVQGLFRRTLAIGEQFGIVVVRYKGEQIEVATFRADGDYLDGRHPERVDYTDDPAEDAQRRDFTVNGLFFDPLEERVIDHVGGVEDLLRGRIQAIGDPDRRFGEDKLRILRAPRFAAVLGFRLEAETARVAKARAHEIKSSGVSPERIHTELLKLLRCPGRALGWRLCAELDLLPVVLPPAAEHAEVTARALEVLPVEAESALLWATCLHRVPPKQAERALRGLKTSNQERLGAVALLKDLPRAQALLEEPVAAQKRLLREPHAELLAELLRAVCLAGEGDLEPLRDYRARQQAYGAGELPSTLGQPLLLTGADLKRAELPPGRQYSRVLRAVEDAQLEGRVETPEAALELARELWQT